MKKVGVEEYTWGKVNSGPSFTQPCTTWSKCKDVSVCFMKY